MRRGSVSDPRRFFMKDLPLRGRPLILTLSLPKGKNPLKRSPWVYEILRLRLRMSAGGNRAAGRGQDDRPLSPLLGEMSRSDRGVSKPLSPRKLGDCLMRVATRIRSAFARNIWANAKRILRQRLSIFGRSAKFSPKRGSEVAPRHSEKRGRNRVREKFPKNLAGRFHDSGEMLRVSFHRLRFTRPLSMTPLPTDLRGFFGFTSE